MIVYKLTFVGRQDGALGVTYYITETVTATSLQQAFKNLHFADRTESGKAWEVFHSLRFASYEERSALPASLEWQRTPRGAK